MASANQSNGRGRGQVRGGRGGRGWSRGHWRNVSTALSGVLAIIGDELGAGAPSVPTGSLATSRGTGRRGRGGRGRGAARVAAAEGHLEDASGSGVAGVSVGSTRKDLVVPLHITVLADDSYTVLKVDAGVVTALTGKNPVLEMVQFRVVTDAGLADLRGGAIIFAIYPNETGIPAKADDLAKKSYKSVLLCDRVPRQKIINIPASVGNLSSGATKLEELVHIAVGVGVMRLSNGLTSTDKVADLVFECLYTHD